MKPQPPADGQGPPSPNARRRRRQSDATVLRALLADRDAAELLADLLAEDEALARRVARGVFCHPGVVRDFSATHSNAKHVPRMLLRALAAGKRGAFAEEGDAALLFVDISGFTRLAARLGVEELKAHINAYFSALLAVVAGCGGDVVAFAGDAVLIAWVVGEGESSSLAQAALAAATCARRMEARCGRYSAGDVTLRLHSGVGCGPVQRLSVAAGGRAQFLVDGPVLAQMAACEGEAQVGEVVVSAFCWPLVKHACRGTPTVGGNWRLDACDDGPLPVPPPPPLAAAADAVQPYVHPKAGSDAELREVVVLFVSVRPRQCELQTVMQAVQGSLSELGGMLRQLIVDDKGTVAIGTFGLVRQEGDCALALACAQAIVARLPAVVGVTCGPVFCGLVGDQRARCDYSVMGASVNLAARLMASPANRDVLCCATTQERAAASGWQFDAPLEPIVAKGYAEPVPVFRPLRQSGPAAADTAPPADDLVGRAPERERIEALLAEGGVLVVEGPGGVGKSALARFAARRAAALGMPVLSGATTAAQRASYLAVWQDVLGGELPPADPSPALGEAERMQRRVAALVARLEPAVAGALLVLEDAAWVDDASWQVFDALRPALHCCLVTTREPLFEDAEVLRLGPLPADDCAALLLRLRGDLPEAARRRIVERSAGNAMFAVALLAACDGDDGERQLPRTVQEAIVARVDRLSAPAQALLKAASVPCSRSFDEFVLRRLAPCDAGAVAGALAECVAAGLLLRAGGGGGGFAFDTPLVRDAVDSLLLESQRAAFHARLAAHFAAHGGCDAAVLAQHWSGAGEHVRAAEQWLVAARERGFQMVNAAAADAAGLGLAALERAPAGSAKALELRLLVQLLQARMVSETDFRSAVGGVLERALAVYNDTPAIHGDPLVTDAYLVLLVLRTWVVPTVESERAYVAAASASGRAVHRARALAMQTTPLLSQRGRLPDMARNFEPLFAEHSPTLHAEMIDLYGADQTFGGLTSAAAAMLMLGDVDGGVAALERTRSLARDVTHVSSRLMAEASSVGWCVCAGLEDVARRFALDAVRWAASLTDEGIARMMPTHRHQVGLLAWTLSSASASDPSESEDLLARLGLEDPVATAWFAASAASHGERVLAMLGSYRGERELRLLLHVGEYEACIELADALLAAELALPSAAARVRGARALALAVTGEEWRPDAEAALAELEELGMVLPALRLAVELTMPDRVMRLLPLVSSVSGPPETVARARSLLARRRSSVTG